MVKRQKNPQSQKSSFGRVVYEELRKRNMSVYDLERLVEERTDTFVRKGYLKTNLRRGRSIRLRWVYQAIREILDIPETTSNLSKEEA